VFLKLNWFETIGYNCGCTKGKENLLRQFADRDNIRGGPYQYSSNRYNSLRLYQPKTNTWTKWISVPFPEWRFNDQARVLSHCRMVYILGVKGVDLKIGFLYRYGIHRHISSKFLLTV
jgi:hypothetical protein